MAKHRAGSLEAAVCRGALRNLMVSSGVLLLLTLAIGLILVSARRAQDLARQQMEFVAAVSHELRTPVSVIGAAAGNLADGVVGDPQRVRKYGETIQGEARRLAETVERVLQLAGIAAAGRPRRAGGRATCRPHPRFDRRLPHGDRGRRASGRNRDRREPADVVGDVTALQVGAAELDQQRREVRGQRPMASRQRLARRRFAIRTAHTVVQSRSGAGADATWCSPSKIAAWASTPTIASTSSSRSIAAARRSRNRSRAAAWG